MPSARAASVTLVALLVLIAALFRTSIKPELASAPEEPVIETPVFSTTPVAVQMTETALAAIQSLPITGIPMTLNWASSANSASKTCWSSFSTRSRHTGRPIAPAT
jgi:hypothetical protein